MTQISREQLQQLKDVLESTPYIQYNGIKIDTICMEEATMHLDMRHEYENPYGMAHGGLLFTLVDTTAGTTARADGRKYVTLNANINYLRSGKGSGRIRSCGKVVHRGRTTTVVDVSVKDEEDQVLCTAVVTMFCISEH